MLKTYLSIEPFPIGILLGTFVIAYAGFMYMGYQHRLHPDQNATGYLAGYVAGTARMEPSRTDRLPHSVDDSPSMADKTSDESNIDAVSKRARKTKVKTTDSNDGLTPEQVAGRQAAIQSFEHYRQDHTDAAITGNHPGLTVSAGSSNSLALASQTYSKNVTGTISGTDRADKLSGDAVTTKKQAVTTATGNTSLATSTGPGEDTGEETGTGPESETETPMMATPNCPYSLPDSSSQDEINQMLSSYGCRYRQSCTKKNDGTPDYNCHWEFIRPA